MNSAEVVVVLHLVFIAFVAGGGLFALRWPRIAWIHLPAVAWARGCSSPTGSVR